MAEMKEVLVPDIGDFADVPVIEVLVAPGDNVAAEDPLVTLESDKATMDVPAPFGGTVAEIKVNVGDTVSRRLAAPRAAGPVQRRAPASAEPAQARAVETAERAEAGASGAGAPRRPPRHRLSRPRPRRTGRRRTPARRCGAWRVSWPSTWPACRAPDAECRITKEDVRAAAEDAPAAAPKAVPSAAPASGPGTRALAKVDFEKYGPVERRPLIADRRRSAARTWPATG